jgi:hypothetical protein
VEKLSADFWQWRASYQPFNTDDIPRIERPTGMHRSWSAEAVEHQRKDLWALDARWKAMQLQKRPVAELVDYQLLGSALARVHWELSCRLHPWTPAEARS